MHLYKHSSISPHNYLLFLLQLLDVSEKKDRVAVKKDKSSSSLKPSSLLHSLLHPPPIPLQQLVKTVSGNELDATRHELNGDF